MLSTRQGGVKQQESVHACLCVSRWERRFGPSHLRVVVPFSTEDRCKTTVVAIKRVRFGQFGAELGRVGGVRSTRFLFGFRRQGNKKKRGPMDHKPLMYGMN